MILGQVEPAPVTETALYTAPSGRRACVKVIAVNKNTLAPAAVRLVHRPGAGPTVDENFLAFDEGIPSRESRVGAVIDVDEDEELRVQADIAEVTFTANGIEFDI